MNLQLVDIVNIIAVFQLGVFILFLLRSKTNIQANRILALFLLSQIMIILNFEIFNQFKFIVSISPHLIFLGAPFFFLAPPSFYLYIKTIAFKDFILIKKHLLHGIPFLLSVVILACFVYFLPGETKKNIGFGTDKSLYQLLLILNIASSLQFIFYFVYDILIIREYRKRIREEYSCVKNINLTWLNMILWGFIISCASGILFQLGRVFFEPVTNFLLFFNFFSFFVYFNIIFFKGLTHPEIFTGIEEKPKYYTSKLKDNEASDYFSKLTSYMQKEKPYLNSNITIKDLSERTTIPARYLSQIINEYAKYNFYDYIAYYRIEEAKRYLSDPANCETVLEVLYKSGFNSKSSFNALFKKFTGQTPSEYKYKNKIK